MKVSVSQSPKTYTCKYLFCYFFCAPGVVAFASSATLAAYVVLSVVCSRLRVRLRLSVAHLLCDDDGGGDGGGDGGDVRYVVSIGSKHPFVATVRASRPIFSESVRHISIHAGGDRDGRYPKLSNTFMFSPLSPAYLLHVTRRDTSIFR